MISLAFHHDRIVAATISDGGDFVLASDVATPDGDYRGWLLAARDAVDALGDGTAAMKVAVALPAIVDEGVVSFTPLATIGQSNLQRDLQSALGREVGLYGFGDCLAAFEARDMPKSDT
ncbi:MAG: hypothetical protein VW175_01485, partial [Alphaproteobacteria bacterium]